MYVCHMHLNIHPYMNTHHLHANTCTCIYNTYTYMFILQHTCTCTSNISWYIHPPTPSLPPPPHVHTHRVEDMMKRSYAEDDATKNEVDRKLALQQVEADSKTLKQLNCPVCDSDLDRYYSSCARIQQLQKQMQVCKCNCLFSL